MNNKIIAAIVVGVMAIFVAMLSIYTIDQGERGVILRNGAIIGTAEPGLGFKIPFIDSVARINIQAQSQVYTDLLTYSRDQQTAAITLSVTYNLPPDQVGDIYAEYGGEAGLLQRLLDRQVPDAIKSTFGRYSAVSAIQEREQLADEMLMTLQSSVVGPIVIVGLQLENIDFSEAYEDSVEQRMLAEVEVLRVRQNAEREEVQAQIAVIQAQAQADARLAQATAEAEAIRMTGEAEASAIRARSSALAENPLLIDLVLAEAWDGVLPTTMVPSGAVPFIDVMSGN